MRHTIEGFPLVLSINDLESLIVHHMSRYSRAMQLEKHGHDKNLGRSQLRVFLVGGMGRGMGDVLPTSLLSVTCFCVISWIATIKSLAIDELNPMLPGRNSRPKSARVRERKIGDRSAVSNSLTGTEYVSRWWSYLELHTSWRRYPKNRPIVEPSQASRSLRFNTPTLPTIPMAVRGGGTRR